MEMEPSVVRRLELLAQEFAELPLEVVVRTVSDQADRLTGAHADSVLAGARRELNRLRGHRHAS